MDIRKIKKLIEMLQESDLREIEVKEGEESVKIVRGHEKPISQPKVEYIPLKSSVEDSHAEPELQSIGSSIDSPIVGTFYRKPAPDKPAFIEVGSQINIGDVVCIVEAMKMMNEIKSQFAGKVISINIKDGGPVEFGQSLIVVE